MGSIMGDEISENSSACHKKSCKILWVPIMPGTQILWVRGFCLFIFELERRARIVKPVEKIVDAAGIETVNSR
jgi:hypothetical protein